MQKFLNLLHRVAGHKVRRSLAGYGSMIDFQFENMIHEEGREWGIWIQNADWQIERNGQIVLNSDFTDRREFERIMKKFDLSTLLRIELGKEFNLCNFVFDNGLSIWTQGRNEDPEDYAFWELFTPDNYVLTFSPGPKVSYEKSDAV